MCFVLVVVILLPSHKKESLVQKLRWGEGYSKVCVSVRGHLL